MIDLLYWFLYKIGLANKAKYKAYRAQQDSYNQLFKATDDYLARSNREIAEVLQKL